MRVGRDSQDQAQILRLSDGLVPDLTTPPPDGPGVCARCSTWTRVGKPTDEDTAASIATGSIYGSSDGSNRASSDGHATRSSVLCENCLEVRKALNREPLGLSVISLYRKPSRLRDVLTRYKGRDDEGDPLDPDCIPLVRSMLGRYLMLHGDQLVGTSGGFEGIVVVPSTDRTPPHPLEDLVDSLDLERPRWQMLIRGKGELGFRRPNRDGYEVVIARESSRILLVDDVYTTGSRINSAAAALGHAGHQTVAALVLARRINIDYADEARQLWDTATAKPFDWQASPRTVAA